MMNRRDFLKTTLASGAAMWLPSYAFARPLLPAKNILFKSTTEALRISVTPAFLDGLSAGAMAIINANALLQVDVYYGSTLLRAYTGSSKAGTGETLTDDLSGWDLTSGWSTYGGAAVTDSDTFNCADMFGGVLKSGATVGAIYKLSFERNTTAMSAALNIRKSDGSGIGTSVSTGSAYKTAITDYTYFGAGNSSAGTTDILSMKAEKILTPSTNGCLLYNSRAMTTQSLAVNTFAAGSYNQSAYTVIFSKPR